MLRTPPRDLPDDLQLPLQTGAPWWYWIGGRPALDLVNTLRERWSRRVETLVDPADLGLWLVHAKVVGVESPRMSTRLLSDARELREAIDALVVAQVGAMPFDPAAVACLDGWLKASGTRPQIAIGPAGSLIIAQRTADDSPRRALGQVALDAAQMLGNPEQAARIRICASPTCSARFYDRSPAQARRWCSMRTCGNTAKVRAHRARVRAR